MACDLRMMSDRMMSDLYAMMSDSRSRAISSSWHSRHSDHFVYEMVFIVAIQNGFPCDMMPVSDFGFDFETFLNTYTK